MTSYLTQNNRKQSYSLYGHGSLSSRRKVKHFSYHPDDCIGKGYSSVVYRGTNDLTSSTVAIKAIDMKGVRDAVSREMLDCQIEALTKLKHPNILKCYDVVREPSHCYIITEFCNEGDLSSNLKKKKRMSQGQVDRYMRDIVAGFVEIGQNNYLHRDLKLANIFLSEGKAVIADFGFAKKNTNSTEKEKYNVGSPLYMSPQALKKNIYSIKNDIWSIGIMIYELLHGETPWECRTEKELMEKMIRVPVKFRDSLNISAELRNFIRKCLEVNEEQRMSLQELKIWSGEHLPKRMSIPSKDGLKQNKPLSQLTNRLSSRSHSNMPKVTPPVNKTNESKASISKADIDWNNNILIIEINTFRLLFKIVQKMRQLMPEEKEVMNTIGNEVVRRVSNLMQMICPDSGNQNAPPRNSNAYGLRCLSSYLDERVNAGIKKYKSVVKEYNKKYNSEITLAPLGRAINPCDILKELLLNNRLEKTMGSEDRLLMYWMVQFCRLSKNTRKEELDAIIEPKKLEITKEYLQQRLRGL